MKILVTTPDLAKQGGVASYYAALRPHLGEDIEYFTVGARQGRSHDVAGIRRMLSDLRGLARKAASGEYSLIHVNPSLHWKALIRDGLSLIIARKHGLKTVVFFRGWGRRLEQIVRGRLPGWPFRSTFLGADAILVLAGAYAQALREIGYSGTLFLESTAVPVSATSSGRSPAKASDGKFMVLWLSRLEKGKGADIAVDAFCELRQRHKGVSLSLAGDGKAANEVRELVAKRQLEEVEFHGFVRSAAKQRVLNEASVYIFTSSLDEGMPNSVLEAMACGLPVITRAVGGIADFFEDGKMGFMTDSLDPRVFADLIERLINDPCLRSRMGEYNQCFAFQHFRAEAVAQRLRAIYADVSAGLVNGTGRSWNA